MNKLRINPKNKEGLINRQDEKSENVLENTLLEDIQFYLKKDTKDFMEEDFRCFEILLHKYNAAVFETSKEISSKLFSISRILIKKNNKLKVLDETQDKAFELLSQLPNLFQDLKPLFQEVIEDNTEANREFLEILIKDLIQLENKVIKKEPLIDSIYITLSAMLNKLQSYNISQQKYIYKSIANSISKKYSNYCIISPEDGDFVDPKFHRIVSGNGQRIFRGLSFIITDKNTDEVLKFGNIKTI